MTKSWDKHWSLIKRLYVEEGRPLKEVRDTMEQEYSFKASVRAYRVQFRRRCCYKYDKNGFKYGGNGSASDGSPHPEDDDYEEDNFDFTHKDRRVAIGSRGEDKLESCLATEPDYDHSHTPVSTEGVLQ